MKRALKDFQTVPSYLVDMQPACSYKISCEYDQIANTRVAWLVVQNLEVAIIPKAPASSVSSDLPSRVPQASDTSFADFKVPTQ